MIEEEYFLDLLIKLKELRLQIKQDDASLESMDLSGLFKAARSYIEGHLKRVKEIESLINADVKDLRPTFGRKTLTEDLKALKLELKHKREEIDLLEAIVEDK